MIGGTRRCWPAAMAFAAFAACGGAPSAPGAPPAGDPGPAANRPPTATVEGGSCHPRYGAAVEPCAVTLTARATDPDGDALTYEWAGCASGTGSQATCVVDAIRSFEATVTVRDGRGGLVLARGEARGSNEAPALEAAGSCHSYTGCAAPACAPPLAAQASAGCTWALNGVRQDAEGDGWSCAGVSVSGQCQGGGVYECGGAADAVSLDFRTLERGTCTVAVVLEDGWGARGTTRPVVVEVR